MTSSPKKYIVTGGGGFVGKALCLALSGLGNQVIAIGRNDYPELISQGITCLKADIGQNSAIYSEAFTGANAVFHTAAKVKMWGSYQDFYQANVIGTRNVINCCLEHGVKKLVYTSSPSVIADGKDLRNVDESYPYPKSFTAFYPQTKATAEQEVLAANSSSLYTIALRPHLIWGPGDVNFVPTIIKRAEANKLIRVGNGTNLTDLCYIEDCTNAHLLALAALETNPLSRGQAYFISQGEPTPLWDWINEILKHNNLPPVTRSIPKKLASCLAILCEAAHRLLPSHPEPLLTRFLVSEMASDHYFDISKAKRELGFQPRYTLREALEKTFGC